MIVMGIARDYWEIAIPSLLLSTYCVHSKVCFWSGYILMQNIILCGNQTSSTRDQKFIELFLFVLEKEDAEYEYYLSVELEF